MLWLTTTWTPYPRLVDLVTFNHDPRRPLDLCQHARWLTEPCVACEGLAILAGKGCPGLPAGLS